MASMERSTRFGRWAAVAVAMGGLVISNAGTSDAVGLPGPVPGPVATVLAPATTAATPLLAPPTGPTLPAPVGGLTSFLTPSSSGTPAGSPSGSSSTSAPAPSPTAPGRGSAATSQAAAPSSSGSSATSSPGSVRATTPVASVCLIPTGTSSPAVDVGLSALGQDLSSPLVQHFPQVFAPCPAGAAPVPGQVAGVDVSVPGLLGLCVRVTRQVAPIQTTLVVLDQNLIQELTSAGVPLQKLAVPCPAGIGSGSSGASSGSGSGTVANAALAGEALGDAPGSGHLAFTGMDLAPALALAAALVWIGTLLLRASRRLTAYPIVSRVERG